MISWDYVQDLKARAEIEGKKRWTRKGKLDPLLEYEMKISGRVFDGLRLIGLKRMPRQVPTLTEYLDDNYGQDNESDEKEQQEQHA